MPGLTNVAKLGMDGGSCLLVLTDNSASHCGVVVNDGLLCGRDLAADCGQISLDFKNLIAAKINRLSAYQIMGGIQSIRNIICGLPLNGIEVES